MLGQRLELAREAAVGRRSRARSPSTPSRAAARGAVPRRPRRAAAVDHHLQARRGDAPRGRASGSAEGARDVPPRRAPAPERCAAQRVVRRPRPRRRRRARAARPRRGARKLTARRRANLSAFHGAGLWLAVRMTPPAAPRSLDGDLRGRAWAEPEVDDVARRRPQAGGHRREQTMRPRATRVAAHHDRARRRARRERGGEASGHPAGVRVSPTMPRTPGNADHQRDCEPSVPAAGGTGACTNEPERARPASGPARVTPAVPRRGMELVSGIEPLTCALRVRALPAELHQLRGPDPGRCFGKDGATPRNRTADTQIFSLVLYQLS